LAGITFRKSDSVDYTKMIDIVFAGLRFRPVLSKEMAAKKEKETGSPNTALPEGEQMFVAGQLRRQ